MEIGELKSNKNFVKELQDIIPTKISAKKKERESEVISPLLSNAFDHFSRNQARQLLNDALSKSLDLMKDKFNTAWYYTDLNKEGHFHHSSSMKYAQLNSQLKFLAKSNI